MFDVLVKSIIKIVMLDLTSNTALCRHALESRTRLVLSAGSCARSLSDRVKRANSIEMKKIDLTPMASRRCDATPCCEVDASVD